MYKSKTCFSSQCVKKPQGERYLLPFVFLAVVVRTTRSIAVCCCMSLYMYVYIIYLLYKPIAEGCYIFTRPHLFFNFEYEGYWKKLPFHPWVKKKKKKKKLAIDWVPICLLRMSRTLSSGNLRGWMPPMVLPQILAGGCSERLTVYMDLVHPVAN